MEIKILGSGCRKCDALEEAVKDVVAKEAIDATVEHVTDMEQIMSFGVMTTPALVIDGRVRVAGRVPKTADLTAMIKNAGA